MTDAVKKMDDDSWKDTPLYNHLFNSTDMIAWLAKDESDVRCLTTGTEDKATWLTHILAKTKNTFCLFTGNFDSDIYRDGRVNKALTRFMMFGGQVDIVLNNYNPEQNPDNDMMSTLRTYAHYNPKKVRLYTTQEPVIIRDKNCDFAVGDDRMYSLTYNLERTLTRSCFNHPEEAEFLQNKFELLRSNATPVKLAADSPVL